MGTEIERKFLVVPGSIGWRVKKPLIINQGYLDSNDRCVIRVRSTNSDGFITIKGKTTGISRQEFEYPIKFEDTPDLFRLCKDDVIQKLRHVQMFEGHKWEVDEFLLQNDGLVIAEIELKSEDEQFKLPPWILKEVTGDQKYYSANLARNPYRKWKKNK